MIRIDWSRMKVLVIDDDKMIRNLLRCVLEDAAFDVIVAEDGQIGLNKINSDSSIDLVITDQMMPNMTGIEFLDNIRDSGNKIPILMLSVDGNRSTTEEARGHGATCWLVKPFDPEQLVVVVKQMLDIAA
ncbi:MAG: hypothetical protein CMP10_19955 [Zetaproteobacteria bacterium]|nr:hypothetical protein [Pseudobdellovibrionaceae bacterium]